MFAPFSRGGVGGWRRRRAGERTRPGPHARWPTAIVGAIALVGCGTIDLGDNFIAPDIQLSEDFFYCRIQPEVVTPSGCANGAGGEAGSCHASRSTLRLDPTADRDPPPACQDNEVVGMVPLSYQNNFDAVQFTVQTDPLSSPFYRRPVGLDSHPRTIFPEGSAEANLIIEWISGATP